MAEIVRGVCADVRATLPSTEDEAGPFLAGMIWMFVIHWTLMLAMTWWWMRSIGGH